MLLISVRPFLLFLNQNVREFHCLCQSKEAPASCSTNLLGSTWHFSHTEQGCHRTGQGSGTGDQVLETGDQGQGQGSTRCGWDGPHILVIVMVPAVLSTAVQALGYLQNGTDGPS